MYVGDLMMRHEGTAALCFSVARFNDFAAVAPEDREL